MTQNSNLTFQPDTHGPPLWAHLGWAWDARARALAEAFGGWTAARLAVAFGLSRREVEALLSGAGAAARPEIKAGDLHVTARALWLRPRHGGGFDAALSADADGTDHALRIGAGSGAEVLAVQGGAALLRLMQAGEPDRLAWVKAKGLPSVWALSFQA